MSPKVKTFVLVAVAATIGVIVSDMYVKDALNIPAASGPGLDDVVDGATVAVAFVILDKIF